MNGYAVRATMMPRLPRRDVDGVTNQRAWRHLQSARVGSWKELGNGCDWDGICKWSVDFTGFSMPGGPIISEIQFCAVPQVNHT